ncbi:MAG: glycosyltransferase family 2 protein, partial [Candidatus Lokiarchaeia archaeon]
VTTKGEVILYNNKKISLTIPCYNEEKGIGNVLKKKPFFVDEVIIIDNNSTDKTADVAKKYGATIVHEKKMGYGYAYLTGLPKAKGDIIVTLDGDNSYPLFELEKMLSYMEKGHYDFVVGCRYPLVHKNAQPLINKIANYFVSWLIRVLFKINLIDSQSGLMVFKKEVLKKIKIQNTAMGFSQEIKIKAFLNPEIKCGEARISYLHRIGNTKFKKIDGIKNLYSVLLLFIELKQKGKFTL